MARVECFHRLRGQCLVILYVLGLVNHHTPQWVARIGLYVATQQVVGGNEHLVAALAPQALALGSRTSHGHHIHLRSELLELPHPVVHKRCRAHDKRLASTTPRQKQAYDLHGLAEAHLVGQYATKAHVRQR